MAQWITLEGVGVFDGRYELAIGEGLTTREWGWIKRLAGYLPAEVDVAQLGDPELICCLAVIALRRAGKVEQAEVPQAFEQLIDAPPTAAFRLEVDPEESEADAGPPAPSSSENGATSGDDSMTNSASLTVATPSGSGPLSSGFSESAQQTSES